MNDNKYIEIINDFIKKSEHKDIVDLFPVSKKELIENHMLCDIIIDYLSDIEMVEGFNIDYTQTKRGKLISEVIDYILHIQASRDINITINE